MRHAPSIELNDKHCIPQLGLGVWRIPDAEAAAAVQTALKAGYRAIDTAAIYNNETGVGHGLKASDVPRKEVFVTTKVWNDDQGFDATTAALDASLSRLGLDYIDLYLVHWPVPRGQKYVETFKAMVAAQKAGKIRSIGVSNFNEDHLKHLMAETGVVPAVNQIELHPLFQQAPLRRYHQSHGIHTESWSPLAQGKLVDHPSLRMIGHKYHKTPAQIVLRWHIELGLIVIPKSVTPSRITDNIDIFDFKLDAADMQALTALDAHSRIGPNPETFPS